MEKDDVGSLLNRLAENKSSSIKQTKLKDGFGLLVDRFIPSNLQEAEEQVLSMPSKYFDAAKQSKALKDQQKFVKYVEGLGIHVISKEIGQRSQ